MRVYKSAFGPEVASSMIEQEAGKHFDPVIVDAFRERFEDFLRVRKPCRVTEGEPIPV